MKFAAPYQLDFDCPIEHEKIDEFNIVFTEMSSFEELRKFIKMYPSHQINIEFSEEGYSTDDIINLCNDYENVYIRIHQWELKYLQLYEEKNINYFFDYTIPIYSYSLLEWVLNKKIKGIYITDDLTYNIKDVYEQCEDKGIKLRIILNEVPAINPLVLSCPTVQVYRPQDYDFLSQYYDVGEFNCGEKYDWVKAEVLYRRWFIDHYWDDDLELMNPKLRIPYPTGSIPPELTRLRSVCKHRCTMSINNVCSKCKRLLLMGYRNADNNLIYKDSKYGLPSLEEMADSIIISKTDNVK